MNRLVLIVSLAMLTPPTAIAEVIIASRLSTLEAERVTPQENWVEGDSSSALGSVTLSTPRGGEFTSYVSPAGMGGGFNGFREIYGLDPGDPESFFETRETALTVYFDVVGDSVQVQFSMNGQSWPPGNSIVRVTDAAETTEYFNADPLSFLEGGPLLQVWQNASWSGELAPGSYRLYAVANGQNVVPHDQIWRGAGDFSFDLAFVPSPHAGAPLFLGGMLTLRRRRRES